MHVRSLRDWHILGTRITHDRVELGALGDGREGIWRVDSGREGIDPLLLDIGSWFWFWREQSAIRTDKRELTLGHSSS